ncbi:SGNH/GDSL hydrolase family protein [Mesobacillus thioparans]|uniref:SGNH/GDSL hydrolase family protein n=1 Tax=Mesobacillus thioparans TaxID=370439 RepID=UPI0039EF9B1B
MKYWLIGVLFLMTVGILVVGKLEWDEKISGIELEAKRVSAVAEAKSKSATSLPSPSKIKPVKLAILGSASTPEDQGAWPALLAQKLKNKAGASLIEVAVKEIKDKTSDEVVKNKLYKDLIDSKPDILLIEPFLLYDNSKIKMDRRLENLSHIIRDFKKANSKIEVIIQPSNPIYGTRYYQKEEAELQKYAKNEGYTYIDHWEAWPSADSKKLQSYLTNNYTPNQKGNELWAEYLAEHLLTES